MTTIYRFNHSRRYFGNDLQVVIDLWFIIANSVVEELNREKSNDEHSGFTKYCIGLLKTSNDSSYTKQY